ncbi:MAG TPA: iron-containing alcohol dehydrogenase, partial [Steroidobacteraceae bacterium]
NWTHTGYAQQIRFGSGVIDETARAVQTLGCTRVLLVTTEGRRRSAAGERLIRGLGAMLVSVFDKVRSHVPTTLIDQALEQLRRDGADCIVSFGGGSCSDLGKAVCYFLAGDTAIARASFFDQPALPHVSIPTAYSGAELTAFFGMTDLAARRKSGAGGATIAPAVVLYDPQVTLDLPVRVSAETAMNALAHCVESAWSPSRTPEAEAIALTGAARIGRWLPIVAEHPADLAARSELLVGAMLGGRCLQNASMGVHHGLAQLTGGRTGIAHGLANALILAHAVRFNADAVPEVIAALAVALGRRDGDAARAIDELRQRVGLPAGLAACGVTQDDLAEIARLSANNMNIAKNPKPVSVADARAILEAAY